MRSLLFVAVGLVVVVALFAYYGRLHTSSGPVVAAAAGLGPVTPSRPGSATGDFRRVSVPLRRNGKPVLMFIGAQYCPYCGAERWAVIKALDRFGTWTNLARAHSTSGEGGFDAIPTFDLLHARYASRYVAFDHKDVADNAGNTLQTLSAQEQQLFNRFDSTGSIPLVFVDGYAMQGSGYSPAELQGRSFAGVTRSLEGNAGTGYVHDINAEANLLTAFLCRADGNLPAGVCGTSVVKGIERGIR